MHPSKHCKLLVIRRKRNLPKNENFKLQIGILASYQNIFGYIVNYLLHVNIRHDIELHIYPDECANISLNKLNILVIFAHLHNRYLQILK